MVNRSWRRPGSLVTVALGVAVCWLLVAIQQHWWDNLPGGHLPYLPDAWYGGYQAMYDRLGVPWGLSPYYFWGRFTVLIYIAALVGAYALPRGLGRVTRVGRRLLLAGIVVGLIGDVIAYWGGTDQLTTLSGVGFGLVESPALLVVTAAMIVYGIGLRREEMTPHWVPWSLIAGGVLSIPVSFLVVTYLPHGILLTILTAIALASSASRPGTAAIDGEGRPSGDDHQIGMKFSVLSRERISSVVLITVPLIAQAGHPKPPDQDRSPPHGPPRPYCCSRVGLR
jgi:hypothetical protein